MRSFNFLSILAAVVLLQPLFTGCVLHADEVADVADSGDEKLLRLLSELASEDFGQRVAASAELKRLTADELQRTVELVSQQPSAEAIVRLLAEVDDRYVSGDEEDVAAASTALEKLAIESRQLMADGAGKSLAEHWHKRVDLAVKQLQSLGAIVKRGAFAPQMNMFGVPDSAPSIQVLIREDWKGGDVGIAVFKRFSNLVGPRVRSGGGLVVFLIDGHPVTPEQRVTLSELVGNNRIAERSRAALGIRPRQAAISHVLIGSVASGGSAEAAGLQAGDLIVAIENPNKKNLQGQALAEAEAAELLRDFDDLVERLKAYRQGDVIQLRIVQQFLTRGAIGGQKELPEEVINVTLKGWEELELE